MTGRQQVFLDAIGQAGLIIFYAIMLSQTSAIVELLSIFAIVLCAWQFINGILSYKFFERQTKRTYVRIAAYTFIAIFAFWGIMWMAIKLAFMSGSEAAVAFIDNIALAVIPALWAVLPILTGALAIWYIYLTIKDLNILINKTI